MMNLKEFREKVENNQISVKEAYQVLKGYHRVYYKNWSPRSEGQSERTENWMEAGRIFDQLAQKVWANFKEKVDSSLSYAYSPRESANSSGKAHIVLKTDFSLGKLQRENGDALCKPRKKFWMLSGVPDESPNCQSCLQKAERYLKNRSK